jgi:hypothetical protein
MKATSIKLPPGAVQELLDRVVYEAVAECVDFETLYRIETMLVMEIAEVCEADFNSASATAREMIDRAWHRIVNDERRQFPFGVNGEMDNELADAQRRTS